MYFFHYSLYPYFLFLSWFLYSFLNFLSLGKDENSLNVHSLLTSYSLSLSFPLCVCVCLFSNLLSLLLHKVRSYSFLNVFFSHQVLVFFVPTTSIMHLLRWTIFHFPFPNSILLFGRLLKSMTSVLSAHLQTYRPASTHRHTHTHRHPLLPSSLSSSPFSIYPLSLPTIHTDPRLHASP